MRKISGIRILLLKIGARIATRYPIPEEYSFSLNPIPSVNFCHFSLNFSNDEIIRKFLVKVKPNSNGLEGIAWTDGSSASFQREPPGTEVCLPFNNIFNPSIKIVRMFGSQKIEYSNLLKFLIGELTFRHIRLHKKEVARQKKFEKKFRFSAERISTLARIVDWRRDLARKNKVHTIQDNSFSHLDLYTELFSMRAWSLEQVDFLLAELSFTLASLVESGDLALDQTGHYSLCGKALRTLSEFEVEDRRAKASETSNTRLIWLTMIMAIAAVVQAYTAFFGVSTTRPTVKEVSETIQPTSEP